MVQTTIIGKWDVRGSTLIIVVFFLLVLIIAAGVAISYRRAQNTRLRRKKKTRARILYGPDFQSFAPKPQPALDTVAASIPRR